MAKAFTATVLLTILLLVYHPPPIERLKNLKSVLLVHPQHAFARAPPTAHPTNYAAITRSLLSKQHRFLAAQLDRKYTHVEHLQRSFLGLSSDATIIVTYSVTYAIGFDLHPDSFSVTGNRDRFTVTGNRDRFSVTGNRDRIIVTLPRPQLVAPPAIALLHHTIPSTSIFINERAAVIALQQRLPEIALGRSNDIVIDDTVIALCEQNLRAFLSDLLAKQPGIDTVPVIEFTYL